MSNVITIKHGDAKPSDGVLQPYELGYVENGALYIGGPKTSSDSSSPPIQLTDPNLLNLIDKTTGRFNIGAIQANSYIEFWTTHAIPKFRFRSTSDNGRTTMALDSSTGQFYIAEVNPDQANKETQYYERYNFPTPDEELTKNRSYDILTSKIQIIGANNYGTTNPNTAGINGTTGQLYFVIAE